MKTFSVDLYLFVFIIENIHAKKKLAEVWISDIVFPLSLTRHKLSMEALF